MFGVLTQSSILIQRFKNLCQSYHKFMGKTVQYLQFILEIKSKIQSCRVEYYHV